MSRTTLAPPDRTGGNDVRQGLPGQKPSRDAVAARRRRAGRRLRVVLWRWRHLVAAIAAAAAAGVAVAASAPPDPPTDEAVVLTRQRPAGTVLRPADLAVRRVPSGLVPEGVSTDPAEVAGTRLAVSLPAGFPVVDGVLVGSRLAAGAPPGTVVVPVRLADDDVTGLLQAGDRVDILSAPTDGGAARVVARGVLVMASTRTAAAADTLGLGAPGSALLLVAVRPDAATLLVGAGLLDPLTAVLVGAGA